MFLVPEQTNWNMLENLLEGGIFNMMLGFMIKFRVFWPSELINFFIIRLTNKSMKYSYTH